MTFFIKSYYINDKWPDEIGCDNILNFIFITKWKLEIGSVNLVWTIT